MTAALQALEDQYILLTNNLSALSAACQNDDEKNALITQYVACRRNYFTAINQMFHDDDPAVIALVNQMKQEQTALQASVAHIGAVAGVITAITTAVQTGAALVAKAG
jgi:hypothetical protein